MEEREISLIDLLVEVLLHWRMFIVWMAVGAILLGAFSYVRSGSTIQQTQAETEKMEQAPEEWLTEEEMRNAKYVAAYENAYLSKVAYFAEASFMKIDANHINRGEVIIVIEAQDHQVSCDIEKAYEGIVQGGEFITKVSEDVGMKLSGINETVLFNRLTVEGNATAETENASCFKIVVINNDEEKCQAMLESVLALLKEKQSDVESALGEHELIVVNKSFGVVADTAVADKQQKVLSDIASMKKTLSDEKEKLSDVERQYYKLLIGEVEAEEEERTVPEAPPAPGISVKYILLGAVMAAFFYAFVLFMIYIFTAKIRSTDNLQELYNIPQLGLIPADKNRKNIFGFVDRWILSLRNHNKRQFTAEEALKLASVAIKMSAGKETLNEICLVGCGLKERSLDVCEKMKAQLEEENIQVHILNNVLYDAQAMGELEKTKGAVLVEGAGATLYQEIAEELKILNRQEIKVLGGILVE